MHRNSVRINDISITNHEHIAYRENQLKKLRLFMFIFLRILTDALLEVFLIK